MGIILGDVKGHAGSLDYSSYEGTILYGKLIDLTPEMPDHMRLSACHW